MGLWGAVAGPPQAAAAARAGWARHKAQQNSFGALSSRIGCGLDGLQWEKVSAILEEVFENTDIKITVYSL